MTLGQCKKIIYPITPESEWKSSLYPKFLLLCLTLKACSTAGWLCLCSLAVSSDSLLIDHTLGCSGNCWCAAVMVRATHVSN